MVRLAWAAIILRNWTWVLAGWKLGKHIYEIRAQNARIANPAGKLHCLIEWDKKHSAWVVTGLDTTEEVC